jgi:hypothetical protein
MTTIRIIHGDSFDKLRAMPDSSVGALISDPPYGLEFFGESFQESNTNGFRRAANPNDVGRDNVFGRTSQTSPEYKTGHAKKELTGGNFTKTGLGDRAIPWPSFGRNHTPFEGMNPTCKTCNGRMRGKKRCACLEPLWHAGGKKWDINGKLLAPGTVGAGFTTGGSDRFAKSQLPSFMGSVPNWVCSKCKGTMRGGVRKGFHPCDCEEPDFPGASEYNAGKMQQMQKWHEGWLKEAFRVLRPGGIAKVFSATRIQHRLATAMENIGFILGGSEAWVYKTGFPKSMSVPFAINRELAGLDPLGEPTDVDTQSSESKQFAGYGTCLKPAHESFIIGRKPL